MKAHQRIQVVVLMNIWTVFQSFCFWIDYAILPVWFQELFEKWAQVVIFLKGKEKSEKAKFSEHG